MPPIRLLVINADDLGFAPGVNRGILEAHAAGTVSSASMMVAAPAFGDAVERVHSEAPLEALTAAGIKPTHIDSHRHAHALPGILPAVAAVAYDAHVPVVRRPLDSPSLLDPVASTKMLVLHAAWR